MTTEELREEVLENVLRDMSKKYKMTEEQALKLLRILLKEKK